MGSTSGREKFHDFDVSRAHAAPASHSTICIHVRTGSSTLPAYIISRTCSSYMHSLMLYALDPEPEACALWS